MNKTVTPGYLHGELRVLPSKSASHRAVMMAALARGKTLLEPMQLSKDIGATLACAQALGLTRGAAMAAGETEGFVRAEIWGGGEAEKRPLRELDCGESGSTLRFFIPLALDGRGPVRLIGHGRLMQRPLTVYQNLFAPLGVVWRQEGDALTVEGELKSGRFELPGDVSSQFITGLLLALPLARRDTSLHVRGAVSTPYLDMTLDTAARFGIEISQRDYEEFYIPGRQRYRSTYFSIEGDWSAAAMLLVAGATAGEVTVRNVSMLSKQADTAICTALVRAGAAVINEEDSVTALHRPLRAFEFDATNCPDLFPALAALAAAADGVSVIRGTSRLEYKECNRSEAIREEYAKLGIEVDTSEEDLMKIRGGKVRAARTQSHGDHRMAMSMAVSALRCDGQITIENAECVAKSYPGFFEDLEKIRV